MACSERDLYAALRRATVVVVMMGGGGGPRGLSVGLEATLDFPSAMTRVLDFLCSVKPLL